jgi:GNAT superfamily N-acetyltransferase
MNIRHATDTDIPAIVDLLKASLGEVSSEKSERYWRWKHIENPFGRSPVLVAVENNQLIGVRAFMRWDWQKDGKVFSSVRAVDTATHPDHQGRGIFKKLTLQLLDECKAQGVDFIYNTPNEQSRPGYLKMGWESAGRLPVTFRLRRPIRMLLNLLKPPTTDRSSAKREIAFEKIILNPSSVNLRTKYSLNYLDWRYRQVPIVTYNIVHEGGSCLIYRLKESRLGTELRICDIFANDVNDQMNLIRLVLSKERETELITLSGLNGKLGGLLSTTLSKGPIVTIRNLNLSDKDMLMNFKRWSPAIGDLELF